MNDMQYLITNMLHKTYMNTMEENEAQLWSDMTVVIVYEFKMHVKHIEETKELDIQHIIQLQT